MDHNLIDKERRSRAGQRIVGVNRASRAGQRIVGVNCASRAGQLIVGVNRESHATDYSLTLQLLNDEAKLSQLSSAEIAAVTRSINEDCGARKLCV